MMGRIPKEIKSKRVTAIGHGTASVTVRTEVTDGPVPVIGRDVVTYLADTDLALILSTLAHMPAYRHVFAAVARVLDEREAAAKSPGARPVDRMAYRLDSLETGQAVHAAVMASVNEHFHDKGDAV